MKNLALIDYSFLNLETPTTPMHVGSLQIFSLPEPADDTYFQELIDFYFDLFRKLEPFNQKLQMPFLGIGMPKWVSAGNFSRQDHFEEVQLPKPGDQAALDAMVAKLNQPLLNRKNPLWKIFLIHGLEDGNFALLFKIHHSCIDGMGGMRLLQIILQKGEKGKRPALKKDPNTASQEIQRRPRPKGAGMGTPLKDQNRLYDGLRKEWDNWNQVFTSFRNTLDPATLGSPNNLAPAPFTAPASPINGKLTSARSFAFRSLDMHQLKALRKKAKVTANDLIMTICSGALRRYMQEKNGLPQQPLTAFVPVSVRSRKGGASGNELSFMLVNLGTHLDDPQKRLELVSASADKGKELLKGMSKAAIKRHASLYSAFAVTSNVLQVHQFSPPPYNVLISNVPASREYLYLNQARLEHLHPVSFLYETQGLNITIVSYEYSIDIGFIACDDIVPDVGHLADLHVEAFAELQKVFSMNE